MRSRRKDSSDTEQGVDSTLVLGDLTDVTQITRSGNIVVLHGQEGKRTITMPSVDVAISFWQALATEASTAINEDRQFFCVSFGSVSAASGTTH